MKTSNMKVYLLHQDLGKPRSISPRRNFRAICKVPTYGNTYIVDDFDDAHNFDPTIMIGSFLINLMRKKKLPLKTKFIKHDVFLRNTL